MCHFKVFGLLCHKYVPDAKRIRLDNKCIPVILIGYHAIGAYKIYDLSTQKMYIIRDIVIDDGSSWDWESRSCWRKS